MFLLLQEVTPTTPREEKKLLLTGISLNGDIVLMMLINPFWPKGFPIDE